MNRQVVRVENRLGLHARAAAKLVRLTTRFSSEILLSLHGAGQRIDGKSILGVLMLAAKQGTNLEFMIQGKDEEEAGVAILQMFAEKFGEEA